MSKRDVTTALFFASVLALILYCENNWSYYNQNTSHVFQPSKKFAFNVSRHTKDPIKKIHLNQTFVADLDQLKAATHLGALRHVALVKTHKCGSDSMATTLLRMADEYSLEVLLPQQISSLLGDIYPPPFEIPRGSLRPDRKFQLMALHTVYDFSFWSKIMAPPAALVGMVRYPLSQFASFFNYFELSRPIRQAFRVQMFNQSQPSPFDFFLENADSLTNGAWKHAWIIPNPHMRKKMMRDTMLFEFGGAYHQNKSVLIDEIVDNFTVIMVKEQFDESLLLLKILLKWKLKDIIYASKNRLSYDFKVEDNKNRTLEARREQLHRLQSPFDYILYRKSVDKLNKQIADVEQFDKQLEEFRSVNAKANQWCQTVKIPGSQNFSELKLTLNATIAQERIVFDPVFCTRLLKSMLPYVQSHIRDYERRKLHLG